MNLFPRKNNSSITIAIVNGIPTQRSSILKPAKTSRTVAASEIIADILSVGQKVEDSNLSENLDRTNNNIVVKIPVIDDQKDK